MTRAPSPPSQIGLIAGNGVFPQLFAKAAKEQGMEVIAVAMRGETDPAIEAFVDSITWVRVGQLGKMIRCFKRAGVTQAAMAGGVRKTRLFEGVRPDLTAVKILAQCAVRRDDGMLRAVAAEYEKNGIEIIDSTLYMPDALAPSGVLTSHTPTDEILEDLRYGLTIAREIGKLDIGQTVIVREGAVVALEAIEGTDACIKRAGDLTGRSGGVMVKVAKPEQDMRFDVPAIGSETIRGLHQAGIVALGIEAGRTLLLDPQAIINTANDLKVVIVGME